MWGLKKLLGIKDSFELFTNKNNFLITNKSVSTSYINESKLKKKKNKEFEIFGYCFLENTIVKNAKITNEQYQYIQDNHSTVSGIFTAISKIKGNITIVLDPLLQYNIFYYIENEVITISNDIFLISSLHSLSECDDRYLFDSLAYNSPLRGLTILKNVFAVQYDDLMNNSGVSQYKTPLPTQVNNLAFKVPDGGIYSKVAYSELLDMYIEKLNKKSKILAENFEEIHIQLTGGADSRLVLSSFLDYQNIYCYVYGDGDSQDRLCFESIVKSHNIKKVDKVVFAGQFLGNSSKIFKALYDTSCRKLNNLNTYMNSDEFVHGDKCKITGYYGANVCGSVVLPPSNTDENMRTSGISADNFTYHDYVNQMEEKYEGLRPTAFKDIFYLNNRGPSHFAAHSIADNLKSNSFDILYDPINIELVKKCPYEESEIDRNAISVDLIHINNPSLALHPYNSRQIPRYRDFSNIPSINAFDGYQFPKLDIYNMEFIRPDADSENFDFLKKGTDWESVEAMLNYEELESFFRNYSFLEYLKEDNSVSSTVLLFYILGTKFFSDLNNKEKIRENKGIV